jgi:hypothetical protein
VVKNKFQTGLPDGLDGFLRGETGCSMLSEPEFPPMKRQTRWPARRWVSYRKKERFNPTRSNQTGTACGEIAAIMKGKLMVHPEPAWRARKSRYIFPQIQANERRYFLFHHRGQKEYEGKALKNKKLGKLRNFSWFLGGPGVECSRSRKSGVLT